MSDSNDAIFIGGPRDQTPFSAGDSALVEVELEGLVHRYIRTTAHREVEGREVLVYNYDGEIDPTGAQSGAETR
jgi:hypothetical protein